MMRADTSLSETKMIDRLLMATVLKIVPYSVTPNHVTIFRFCLVPIVGWLLWKEYYIVSLIVFVTSAFTDVLDGALARTRNQRTQWGTRYDPLADKLLIITAGAILMMRFLNPYIFFTVASIEVLIIVDAILLKMRRNVVHSAHATGKIKMFLQTLSIVGLLLYGIAGNGTVLPLVIVSWIVYVAIGFGFASLIIYHRVS